MTSDCFQIFFEKVTIEVLFCSYLFFTSPKLVGRYHPFEEAIQKKKSNPKYSKVTLGSRGRGHSSLITIVFPVDTRRDRRCCLSSLPTQLLSQLRKNNVMCALGVSTSSYRSTIIASTLSSRVVVILSSSLRQKQVFLRNCNWSTGSNVAIFATCPLLTWFV